ncbi:MAG: lysine transporter LysE [Fusobacterium sp.]|nr:lysine transporter LysE [Fusobacterium sp.]
MDLSIIKGLITGIILSLPFGPVGIYCMELTISEGKWKGYATALGMVTVDLIYSALSLFFVLTIDEYIIKYGNYLSLFIGIILFLMAGKKLLSNIQVKEFDFEFKTMFQNYLTGVGLALTNITSILVISSIFSFLKVYNGNSTVSFIQIPLGVFIGGGTLWFFTVEGLAHFRKIFKIERLVKIIKLANTIILIVAILIIFNSLKKIFLF